MRLSRTLFPLLASALLLAAWSARADTLEPECTPQNEGVLRERIAQLVTTLKAANYGADMALMARTSEKLESLLGQGSCPEAMRLRLCDADCHYQRASVFLFRATDLALLSSKGSSSSAVKPPGQLLAEADRGIAILEQGLGRLPRQRIGGDTGKDAAFNRYLKASALLSTLKARLLMAQGDIWYRQASVSRVENLNFLINTALGGSSSSGSEKGSPQFNAMTRYDEAFWLLMETRGSLPPRELFTSELAALATAEQDVTLRIRSVRKGFLYLNIDPDDFTLHSASALGKKLKELNGELAAQESGIETLTKEWQRQYADLQNQKFDTVSASHARAIDLEVRKLEEMQNTTEALKLDIQKKLDGLDRDITTFEHQQQIRIVEAELRRQTLELNNQLSLIENQKEQDVLAFRKEDVRDDMSNIQFNIDMTMAEQNFTMQLAGLDLQIKELDHRIEADVDDIDILRNRKAELQKRIELEKQRAAAAGIVIKRVRQAQATLFKSARVPIVQRICAVDAQLAFYDGASEKFSDPISSSSCSPPSGPQSSAESKRTLNKKICEARETLQNKSEADLELIKQCLDGGRCPAGGENVKEAVKKASEENMKIFEAQKESFRGVKTFLEKQKRELEQVRAHFQRIRTGTKVADAALVAAEIFESVSESKVSMTGPIPTIQTSSPLEKAAEAATIGAEMIVLQLEREFEDIQFKDQLQAQEDAIGKNLIELETDIRLADQQGLFEQAMKNRALAEINVRLAELDRERQLTVNEKAVQKLECKDREGDIESTVARLRAERASLVGELQAQEDDTALSPLDIETQENLRAQAQTETARLTIEDQGLDLEIKKLEQDQRNLGEMKKKLAAQIKDVKGFQTRVDALKNDFEARKAVLQELKTKVTDMTTRMTEAEKTFVLAALEDANKAAASQISDLEKLLEKHEGKKAHQEQLHALQQQLFDSVDKSNKKIMSLVTNAPTSNAEPLFWDFANLQAELSRGAPEFIDAKRRLLQDINYTYNLYRNRYNMLTRFARGVPALPKDTTFVRNTGDVERLLGKCATLDSGGGCQPDSLTWDKDTMTGTVAEFNLEKNSALIQRLLSDRRVRFELSPFAKSQADSRNLGNFVLWNPKTMNDSHDMLLVGVVAKTNSGSCEFQKLKLRHLGLGATFSRLSVNSEKVVPSLVVKRPVEGDMPVYGGTNESTLAIQEYNKFRTGAYTAEQLEERLHATPEAYPFVGYPLVATYELVANENLIACLNESPGHLTLGFIFVQRKQREQ